MKKLFFVFAVSLVAFGCGSSVEAPENANGSNTAPATVDNGPGPVNPTASSETAEAAPKSEGMEELNASDGKYLGDLKFWENRATETRLKKLMGADYDNMKKYWNTQSPVKVDGDIVMATGCEQHNCGSNQYVLFADTGKDIIHVVHIKDGKSKEFREDGDITLPKAFADDLAKIKGNSK
ncbi:MAG: hypothetical protein KF685_02300 [Acidobacteria bacterium]|nr:hypothetical protein [Acidobacteriota bacterium]